MRFAVVQSAGEQSERVGGEYHEHPPGREKRARKSVPGSGDGIKLFKSMITYIEQCGHRKTIYQEFLQ